MNDSIDDIEDLILFRSMQKFPTRTDMMRAKPGKESDKDLINSFADTRKDPIKRRKIHRVLDFVESNREAYKKYLSIDDANSPVSKKVVVSKSAFGVYPYQRQTALREKNDLLIK